MTLLTTGEDEVRVKCHIYEFYELQFVFLSLARTFPPPNACDLQSIATTSGGGNIRGPKVRNTNIIRHVASETHCGICY